MLNTRKPKAFPEAERRLYEAILQLKTNKECFSFFRDLCTPAEIRAMQERWQITELLHTTKLSYRQIHKETGISLTTIGRVSRFLKEEAYKGYKLILYRLYRGRE